MGGRPRFQLAGTRGFEQRFDTPDNEWLKESNASFNSSIRMSYEDLQPQDSIQGMILSFSSALKLINIQKGRSIILRFCNSSGMSRYRARSLVMS